MLRAAVEEVRQKVEYKEGGGGGYKGCPRGSITLDFMENLLYSPLFRHVLYVIPSGVSSIDRYQAKEERGCSSGRSSSSIFAAGIFSRRCEKK